MIFTLEMYDGVSFESTIIEVESQDEARSMVEEEITYWVTDGDWGDEGASIDVRWQLLDNNNKKVDDGWYTINIDPDHEALMREVANNPDCEHVWTSQGEGGLKENPGVWATGGTSMVFKSHCRKCGLHKTECHTGSQRNPGEHDSVEYTQLDKEDVQEHISKGDMDYRAPMSHMDAVEWVQIHNDDDELDDNQLLNVFRTLYEREPLKHDYELGLWSLCCAAIQSV